MAGLVPAMTAMRIPILGVIQSAIISPSVDDSAVTNDPHVTSIMTTGHVQCFNSDSDVSSKVT
jgi:hypothetical protein